MERGVGIRRVSVAAAIAGAAAIAAGCGGPATTGKPVAYPIGRCAPRAMQGAYWVNGPLRHLRDRNGDKVNDDCVTVRGKVMSTKMELDGDMHIRLLLDRPYRHLLAPGNLYQDIPDRCAFPGKHVRHCTSNLFVVEIIPQHCHGVYPYNQNCADKGGFIDPAYPRAGDYIEVTGYAVRDFDPAHHDVLGYPRGADGWAEIHPATAIKVLKAAAPHHRNPHQGPSDVDHG